MVVDSTTLIITVIIILLVVIYIDSTCPLNNFSESNSNIENLEMNNSESNTNIDINLNDTSHLSHTSHTLSKIDPQKLQIITAGLGPEVKRLGELETELSDVRIRQIMNTNLLSKLVKKDVMGDYITRGWFVQVYDVLSTPIGISLGSEIDRYHGIRRICFRAQDNYPFLGIPQDPMYLPKASFIGFRAMTVFKIPKTGYYQFRVLSDDGSRLMYQIVDSDVTIDEKNVRNVWKPLIDQWRFQAETWQYSSRLYFNQSDLVLLRFDYFQADENSTACIKVRYSEIDEPLDSGKQNNHLDSDEGYTDFNIGDLYCSLLWSNVPLMGIR